MPETACAGVALAGLAGAGDCASIAAAAAASVMTTIIVTCRALFIVMGTDCRSGHCSVFVLFALNITSHFFTTATPYAGDDNGLPFGTIMNTTARAGASALAEPPNV